MCVCTLGRHALALPSWWRRARAGPQESLQVCRKEEALKLLSGTNLLLRPRGKEQPETDRQTDIFISLLPSLRDSIHQHLRSVRPCNSSLPPAPDPDHGLPDYVPLNLSYNI